MSAWDITGLIVWGFLALIFASGTVSAAARGKWSDGDDFTPSHAFWSLFIFLAFASATIFCAARLLGAHA